jgi:K(+)-stimulated pyrophosphate-energized sodium pump
LNPLIKVMNLVSLLMVPLIVSQAENTALRASVVIVGVAILAFAIWWSKSREVDELETAAHAPAPATPAPSEAR